MAIYCHGWTLPAQRRQIKQSWCFQYWNIDGSYGSVTENNTFWQRWFRCVRNLVTGEKRHSSGDEHKSTLMLNLVSLATTCVLIGSSWQSQSSGLLRRLTSTRGATSFSMASVTVEIWLLVMTSRSMLGDECSRGFFQLRIWLSVKSI